MGKEFDKEIIIDGSFGEGGGQVLRTALSISSITGMPVKIHHIRAGRKIPGLQPQHLTGVEALSLITHAQTQGARIGSEEITFIPGKITPGNYRFDIKTAGSVTLLLQTLLLPLSLASDKSSLTLIGGTHVPWSPPFHYFNDVLFPILKSMGISINGVIKRWGWYPRGEGLVHIEIEPVSEIKPVSLIRRGKIKRIRGLSAISNLPRHVGERQRDYALKKIEKELKMNTEIEVIYDVPSSGPGSFFFLVVETEGAIAGFSSLGKKGIPAEKVSDDAYKQLKDYIQREECLDPHLSDQIVPFMALAKDSPSFSTTKITDHMLTNIWVVRNFFNKKILLKGEKGGGGEVEFFND